MEAEKQPNNNNDRKRKVVKIYDTEKVPEYANKVISQEWGAIIRQDIPKDFNMMYFYVVQLYELAMCRMRDSKFITNLSEIDAVYRTMSGIQKCLVCERSEQFKIYNKACCNGKLSLSGTIFLCISTLNQYILGCLGTDRKLTDHQLHNSFEWAKNEKVIIFNEEGYNECTQMNLYIQIQALASKWSSVKKGEGNESLHFVSLLEDKLSGFLTLKQSPEVMDGTLGPWTRDAGGVLVPTVEYIDDLANMFLGFYRSLYILEKIQDSFNLTLVPQQDIQVYNQLYKSWLEKKMYEPVLQDQVSDARKICVYYCIREGEIERSLREKNGVKLNSTKWVLHVTRCYKQIVWFLEEHTYTKKGIVNNKFPRWWQKHCLKLNVFLNILGAYGINLCTSVFIQERNFWKLFLERHIMKNPFIVEVMGEHMVIFKDTYYSVKSVEDAFLLWMVLMKKLRKGLFIDQYKCIDISAVIDSHLSMWNLRFQEHSNIGGDMGDNSSDIVV